MIRRCTESDFAVIQSIVNEAAEAYHGIIPDDRWHDPYMSAAALSGEIAAGVEFWGWDEAGELIGVMGAQSVRDVTLIRHAYVRTARQGKGIGGALLDSLAARTTTPLLVGTWAAADWAIRFYQAHGFRVVSPDEKDRLLATYWKISARQAETSVVLISTRHAPLSSQ